jgi:hypothetical protein
MSDSTTIRSTEPIERGGYGKTVTPSRVSKGVPGGATTLLNDREAGWTGRVQHLEFLPNRFGSPDRDIVRGMKRVAGDDGFVRVHPDRRH